MVMPTPERLPPPPLVPPVATPTPTPSAGPMMTPAVQSIAPPAAPTPMPSMPARARTQEMPVPEQPVEKLGKWDFLAAKQQFPPLEGVSFEAQAFSFYQHDMSSKERADFDEEWEHYYYGIVPEGEGVAGGAAPIFSPQEERMLTDLQNAISVGQLDESQAWKQLESYWAGENVQARRAEEAGRRGETMLAGAFPGPTLPLTGPGGMGAKLQEQYGLPDLTPAIQGIPMSQAQGVFGQAQTQMGLPETLGPISPPNIQLPNWGALGQTMPQFGGRNFFEQLLQEGRSTGF